MEVCHKASGIASGTGFEFVIRVYELLSGAPSTTYTNARARTNFSRLICVNDPSAARSSSVWKGPEFFARAREALYSLFMPSRVECETLGFRSSAHARKRWTLAFRFDFLQLSSRLKKRFAIYASARVRTEGYVCFYDRAIPIRSAHAAIAFVLSPSFIQRAYFRTKNLPR